MRNPTIVCQILCGRDNYLTCTIATTLHDVRLELAKEDAKELNNGVEAPHKISITSFLVKGLDLEEQQYVILN